MNFAGADMRMLGYIRCSEASEVAVETIQSRAEIDPDESAPGVMRRKRWRWNGLPSG